MTAVAPLRLTHSIRTMCRLPRILLQSSFHRYRHQQKMNKTINDSKAAILEAHNAIYVIKTDYLVKQPSELAARECFIKLEHTCCEFGLHIRNVDWTKKNIKIPTYWRSWRHRLVVIGAHNESTVRFGDRVGFKWFSNVSHSFNYGYLFSVLIIGFTVFQVIVWCILSLACHMSSKFHEHPRLPSSSVLMGLGLSKNMW